MCHNVQDGCSWRLDTFVLHTGTGKGAKLPGLHSDPKESALSCGPMDSLGLFGVGVALLEECVTVGVGSYAQAMPSVAHSLLLLPPDRYAELSVPPAPYLPACSHVPPC